MTNNSADNVADKDFTTIDTLTGTLKEETSITNPTIRISYNGALQNVNYFYVPQFQRYYFVTDIRSIRNNIWDISGHCDVLTTALKLSNLGDCMGITKKQENKKVPVLHCGDYK